MFKKSITLAVAGLVITALAAGSIALAQRCSLSSSCTATARHGPQSLCRLLFVPTVGEGRVGRERRLHDGGICTAAGWTTPIAAVILTRVTRHSLATRSMF